MLDPVGFELGEEQAVPKPPKPVGPASEACPLCHSHHVVPHRGNSLPRLFHLQLSLFSKVIGEDLLCRLGDMLPNVDTGI